MRQDRRIRRWRMIPGVKVTNTTASAATYGSGGNGTLGIVDTRGLSRVRIEVSRGKTGTASKIKSVHIGFQSGATTLMASSTLLSGYTSGNVFTSTTASGNIYAFDINLLTISNRKRYLNCKVVTSTTSNNICVDAFGTELEQFPPSTTGYTSITNIG